MTIIKNDLLLNRKLRVLSDITISGIDLGSKLLIVKNFYKVGDTHSWVLLKRPSCSTWAGIGLTQQNPTAYYLLKLDEDKKILVAYEAEFGRSPKKGILELEKLIDK